MLTLILVFSAAIFIAAFFGYGRILEKWYDIDHRRVTPSHADYDGIDRVPAPKAVLLGHHFSSVAGAGPVLGPIIAAVAFGWLPVLLWVLFGAILIGGVHDFSALVISIRHKARSIAEIAREHMSPLAYKLFLAFIWLTLVYVLTVFTDLTAATFVSDGGVASASLMFIVLAIGFGVFVYRLKIPVLWSSLLFVPLVFVCVWLGQKLPIPASSVPAFIGGDPAKTWDLLLIVYCFLASVLPVWILLQPRDYLSSFLLYGSVLGGFLGILFGGFAVAYPAFTGWSHPQLGGLFPILFITVACGACSGFHAVVASGTSSKQLDKETDARPVAYGAMMIEGLVAVIAIITVAMLAKDDPLSGRDPLVIYGTGIGKFLSVFGIPASIGYSFGLLALSTFILTTLDTATRLNRYIFEEFFNLKNVNWRYPSTIATLILPAIFVLISLKDPQGKLIPAWKVIWPVFGATNQLLAGLVLLVITVWLKKNGKKAFFTFVPMVFMNVMTVWSLVLLLNQYRLSAVGIIAGILLLLALVLMVEAVKAARTLWRKPPNSAGQLLEAGSHAR
ncbi:MAG: carbon starvation protein A [Planctomycetaceae bacterium]|nr:carbon starvation protein A [Planctomycetaceae bacterium]